MNGLPSITEVLSITRIISAAELLAFAGGEIEVVPSPGAGKLIVPLSTLWVYNFGTVDFSRPAQLDLQYSGTTLTVLLNPFFFLTGLGSSQVLMPAIDVSNRNSATASVIVGTGLSLVLLSGAFALSGVGAASVTAGGTGYAIGDTGTIITGGTDATYQVLSVSGLGAVLTFAITFPGHGYATGAGQATATGGAQPGVGIHFTVNVLTLVNGDGSIKVTTHYKIIDVP